MLKIKTNKVLICISSLAILLTAPLISHASSCTSTSPNLGLVGSWATGNFMGDPTIGATILYDGPKSQKVRKCDTWIQGTGFPFFRSIERTICSITYECTAGAGYIGIDLFWWTFNKNHINEIDALGEEVGDWVVFHLDGKTPINLWARETSNSNKIDFVRDIAPLGDNYTWKTLERE